MIVHSGREWNRESFYQVIGNFSIDGLHVNTDKPQMSLPAFEAFCRHFATNTLLSKKWQGLIGKIQACVMEPIPSETILKSTEKSAIAHAIRKCISENDSTKKEFDILFDIIHQAHRNKGNMVVAPPVETISDSTGLTESYYSAGSARLGEGRHHKTDESHHMNKEYGKLVIKELLSTI